VSRRQCSSAIPRTLPAPRSTSQGESGQHFCKVHGRVSSTFRKV
jgi:hypothetical protein